MDEYYVLILALAATGALAGLIAGLFGIGGGIVMVPAMYYVFGALGYEGDRVMHVAVGTSLAVIIATSLRSVSAHAKKGAVDFDVLKQWVPFIVIGTLIGTVVAEFVAGSGTSTGLAWRIIEAGNRLEIARMFAALVLLSGLGIALFWALSALEHLLLRHWHDSRDGASESSQTG